MDIELKNSIRNSIWAFSIVSIVSFVFGGIYTEIIGEGIGFSLENIIYALLGSLLAGAIFFMPVFVFSLMYYYFKNKR